MELRQLDKRLDYYTPVIIASEDTLKNKPEMTKKFLEATAKGYRYAIEHPKESAEILHKYAPDYSLEMLTMSQEYLAGKYMEDTKRWGESERILYGMNFGIDVIQHRKNHPKSHKNRNLLNFFKYNCAIVNTII